VRSSAAQQSALIVQKEEPPGVQEPSRREYRGHADESQGRDMGLAFVRPPQLESRSLSATPSSELPVDLTTERVKLPLTGRRTAGRLALDQLENSVCRAPSSAGIGGRPGCGRGDRAVRKTGSRVCAVGMVTASLGLRHPVPRIPRLSSGYRLTANWQRHPMGGFGSFLGQRAALIRSPM